MSRNFILKLVYLRDHSGSIVVILLLSVQYYVDDIFVWHMAANSVHLSSTGPTKLCIDGMLHCSFWLELTMKKTSLQSWNSYISWLKLWTDILAMCVNWT